MARLIWDTSESRRYETGVDRGVLFLPGLNGIPWNGLVEVSETPDGGAVTSYWMDGVKYLDSVGGEDYKASISAFTYPDEFEPFLGNSVIQQGLFAAAQPRSDTFSLSYRTRIVDCTETDNFAYRLHIIFNAVVAPLQRDYKTLTNTAQFDPFKWDIVASPVYIPSMKPTAHLIIDSRFTDAVTLRSIENTLYGSKDTPSHLPTVENLINIIVQDGSITITDNGDGTWTAIGPDEFITIDAADRFEITNANVTMLDDVTYTIQDTTNA